MKKVLIWELHGLRIVEMRRSGYTLQEIGDSIGVTRERVRQVLQERCGRIEKLFLTESEVASEIGCSIWRVVNLRKRGILKPCRRGNSLNYYDRGELENIRLAIQRYCLNCGEPLPINHIGKYCANCKGKHRRKRNVEH